MVIPRRRLFTVLAWGTALFVLGSAGCEVKSPYMVVLEKPKSFAASKDVATVVFLRPYDTDPRQVVTIVDEHRTFIGDSLAQSYFATKLPPGGRTFYTLAQGTGTDAMRADLAPGKVYFVYISLGSERGGAAQAASLFALTPRSREWGLLSTWLAKSRQLEVAPASGTLEGTSRYPDIEQRITQATTALRNYPVPESDIRTLRPDDGL
jgi:hypothetical protein